MLRQVAPPKNAAVYLGMQGFHPTVQHFREAGVVADFGDRNVVVAEQFGGAAGGKDFDTESVQGLGEFDNAAFIGNADKSTLDDSHGKEKPGKVTEYCAA